MGEDALLRIVPTLLLMVGALLVVRWWAKRGQGAVGGQAVRVVSRTGLARGALLAVVEVHGRRLLVGVTENGVSLLTELESEEADTDLAAYEAASDVAVRDLARTRPATTSERPWIGLVDRLREMTVRTSPGPLREPRR